MKKILLLFTIILGITSCSDYLDVNTDPNSPDSEDVTNDMIMPAAEMNVAASYGDFLRTLGGYFSQQFAQDFGTSNYLNYSRFNIYASTTSSTYAQLYVRALNNLQTIRDNAEDDEEWGSYLAATVLRCFTFQVLVDCYGETPYTEALDIENTTPAYDDGEDVYNGILDELDDALDKVSSDDLVCDNFLFSGSTDVENWIELANALKLKILMRMSKVEDVQSQLADLISEDNFPAEDVSWDDCWSDEDGSASPWYSEEYASYSSKGSTDICANLAYIQTMIDNGDARYAAFFNPNDEDGSYTGGISGTNFTGSDYSSSYFCEPVYTYDMPVYLISQFETEFFLAEYYARYGSSTDAQEHYEAAITASFESAGLTDTEAAVVYDSDDYKWNDSNYEKLIGVQKWIALGGTNNFEAWCELRRLNYPEFNTAVSGDDIYNTTTGVLTTSNYTSGYLYTPVDVNSELGDNQLLERFKYANTSSSTNSNVPDNVDGNVPVFWADFD